VSGSWKLRLVGLLALAALVAPCSSTLQHKTSQVSTGGVAGKKGGATAAAPLDANGNPISGTFDATATLSLCWRSTGTGDGSSSGPGDSASNSSQ